MMAGIWSAYAKPPMTSFLQPIFEQMNKLQYLGEPHFRHTILIVTLDLQTFLCRY